MAQDTARRVEYYHVTVQDKPGEGARVLARLAQEGVNLLAMHAFPTGDGAAQIDLFPENPERFVAAARRAGLALGGPRRAFLITGDDRPGAAAAMLERIAQAGVNVTAATASCGGKGGFGMVVWVRPESYEAAAAALGI